MSGIRVSVVSYLNSTPFIYGLQHSALLSEIELSLDIPSVCAEKTISGAVDLGLIPVAAIPLMKEHYIVSDYCIGAEGKVNSVMLYSEVPLEEISDVLLDYQSRTSVSLVRVLAERFWKIQPAWTKASENYEDGIKGTTAAVIIGDRTFGLANRYKYTYDLAEEWQKFTGLPFVFACWVANKPLAGTFLEDFNAALAEGIRQRPLLIAELSELKKFDIDVKEYLGRNISYTLDGRKRQALELFLTYLPPGGF